MAIKCILIFLISFSLSACLDFNQERFQQTFKEFTSKENNKAIKVFNREELKGVKYPLIEIQTNGILIQALMLALTERENYVNYSSGSGQQLTMQGGLITKTKGMGTNLVSLAINKNSPFLIRQDPNKWPSNNFRTYGFLNPSNQIDSYIFSCKLIVKEKEIIEIVNINYSVTKVLEECDSQGKSFANLYWVSDNGFIWRSKQWISPKEIYAYTNIINPLN